MSLEESDLPYRYGLDATHGGYFFYDKIEKIILEFNKTCKKVMRFSIVYDAYYHKFSQTMIKALKSVCGK